VPPGRAGNDWAKSASRQQRSSSLPGCLQPAILGASLLQSTNPAAQRKPSPQPATTAFAFRHETTTKRVAGGLPYEN